MVRKKPPYCDPPNDYCRDGRVYGPSLAIEKATAVLRREIETRFEAVDTRFLAIDQATKIVHDDYVRVPTVVDKAIAGLSETLNQRFLGLDRFIATLKEAVEHQQDALDRAANNLRDTLEEKILTLGAELDGKLNVSDERFRSVQTQFTLLKQATEQLDLANKTAIAAALQAQKESAGETQKSSQAAIAKSETSTSEAIKALTTAFNAAITGATDRINDLKGRMDRGEGKSNLADPQIERLMIEVQALRNIVQTGGGIAAGQAAMKTQAMNGLAVGAAVVGASLGALVGHFLH